MHRMQRWTEDFLKLLPPPRLPDIRRFRVGLCGAGGAGAAPVPGAPNRRARPGDSRRHLSWWSHPHCEQTESARRGGRSRLAIPAEAALRAVTIDAA